jgi:hypothetical protein
MKAVGYGDNRTALAFGRQKFSVRRTETRNWKTAKSMHLVPLISASSPNRQTEAVLDHFRSCGVGNFRADNQIRRAGTDHFGLLQ